MNIKEEKFRSVTNKEVVKIGGAVHRFVKGEPILHSYLKFLEDEGMEGVPRFLGLDEKGREILTYLPGKTQEKDNLIGHPCMLSDDTVIDMARFMRRLHDISAEFLPTAMEYGWNNPDFPQDPPDTICHNDAGSWNWVFVNDRLTGLFDFDSACLGTRMWDLTLPVFSIIPLTPYMYDAKLQEHMKYDSHRHEPERKRRIKLFFDAYGMDYTSDFLNLLRLRMMDFCKHSTGRGLIWYEKVLKHITETGHDWL